MIPRDPEPVHDPLPCPVCGGDEFAVIRWWHPVVLHWLLNPGCAVVELIFGARVPSTVYFCTRCPGSKYIKACARCPSCGRLHSSLCWQGRNGLGHWFGLVCPDCGAEIPCLWNWLSIIVLAVTALFWSPVLLFFGPRIREWDRRRAVRQRLACRASWPTIVGQPVPDDATGPFLRNCAWQTAPPPVKDQVRSLVADLHGLLRGDLVGVYLHGSLAMGGFNPAMSDVDLLVVTKRRMTDDERREAARLLVDRSMQPSGVEISFLSRDQLHPWRHPAPYDFHYSETHRERITADLAGDAWRRWADAAVTDEDLAAHVVVTRERGLVLWGEAIPRVFPDVPRDDFLASLLGDVAWFQARLNELPFWYPVQNLARFLGMLRTGRIMSKAEGVRWAMANLPDDLRGLVAEAVRAARGNDPEADCDHAALREFVDRMLALIRIEPAMQQLVARKSL